MTKIPKNYYNEDLVFIRGFNKISVTNICKKLKLPRTSIVTGRTLDIEKYKLVRKEIEKEIAKLYLK